MPALRIAANEQQQPYVRQLRKQLRSPDLRALTARRQVATLRPQAGKAEAHGDDGDFFRVIERVFFQRQPLPQALARGIVERATTVMGANARRLAGDADSRRHGNLQYRPRLLGQGRAVARLVAADPAGADGGHLGVQRSWGLVHGGPFGAGLCWHFLWCVACAAALTASATQLDHGNHTPRKSPARHRAPGRADCRALAPPCHTWRIQKRSATP